MPIRRDFVGFAQPRFIEDDLNDFAVSWQRVAERRQPMARQGFFSTSACLGAAGLLLAAAAVPARAGSAIAIQQSSATNIAHVIQEQSSVVSINHSATASNGSTTVTDVVQIGSAIGSLSVAQQGRTNQLDAFQQGAHPKIQVQQSGVSNTSRYTQIEIP
jgi:hypothetical protein